MTTTEQHFPPGWDEDRVKRLISHYDSLTEEEQVAEDEASVGEQQGQTVITVLDGLLLRNRQSSFGWGNARERNDRGK